MPTVKEYRNENGYYIRSNIDGHFVTLQLSPEAEGLFSDLGFRGDDQISWQLLKPLCDCGHAYTNNSGAELATDEIDSKASIPSEQLSEEKKRRLEGFLDQHTRESLDEQEDDSISTADGDRSHLEEIDESKRGFIESWSPSDDEYEATLNRIARANDVSGILKSISHHSTEHPILVNRFRVSSQEVPTFSFDTDGISWTVHDFRTVNKVGTDAELFFDIQPGTSHSQSITVGPETTEWHTESNQFTSEQIEEFLIVAPDLLYYIEHLVDGPDLSPQDIVSDPTADISLDDTSRVEAFRGLQEVEPGEYDRVLGAVLTMGEKGYGRIRAHTGRTFPFSSEDVEGGSIEPGEVVTFEVKPHRGTIYADSIRREESEIPSSKIVRNWPEYNDCTISDLHENWLEKKEKDNTDKKSISIGDPDSEEDRQKIELEIDSLAIYLTDTTAETGEIIDESVRTLLKDTIDGTKFTPQDSITTQSTEISLPSNLLSMVDSVVRTSSIYDSRSQFFNAALQQNLDGGDSVELTVRVPRSYHNAVQQLSEERGVTISGYMRAALEGTLRTEFSRK